MIAGTVLNFFPWLYPLSRSSVFPLTNVYHRVSLSYGHPYMIDVNDCDARLPSSGTPYDFYVDELVRLSIILGRVLKTIYRYSPYAFLLVKFTDQHSPAGLMNTTDEALATLLSDIENWKKNLPPNLQFRGPDSPVNAGSWDASDSI